MHQNGGLRTSRVLRPNISRPSCGRRTSYDGPMSRQQRKGRDPGRAHRRRKNHRNSTTRIPAIMGRQRLDRRLTEPTSTRSETITSPMGTRMPIGTPSGAMAVLGRTNGRAAEEMGTRKNSFLRRRRWRRR